MLWIRKVFTTLKLLALLQAPWGNVEFHTLVAACPSLEPLLPAANTYKLLVPPPAYYSGPSYGTSEHEGGNVRKLVDVLAEDSRMRCCLVDRRESLSRFATGAAAAIPVTSDEEAVQQVAKEVARQTYGFLWTQLLGLYTFQVNR